MQITKETRKVGSRLQKWENCEGTNCGSHNNPPYYPVTKLQKWWNLWVSFYFTLKRVCVGWDVLIVWGGGFIHPTW